MQTFRPVLAIVGQVLAIAVLFYPQWSQASTPWIVGVSFIVMFLVMAIVYWISMLSGPYMPAGWLRIRRCERGGLYRWLGVLIYRWLLLRSPFAGLNKRIHLRSRMGLPELERHMREAEVGHYITFALMLALTVFFALLRDPRFFLWLSLCNLIGNVYPIWLQRYNRMRVHRLLHRFAGSQPSSQEMPL